MLCLLPRLVLSCAVCRIRACTPVSIIMSSHRAEELRNIYQEDIHYFVQHGSSLLKKLYKTRPASHSSEQVSFPRARVCLIPVSFGFWAGGVACVVCDCGVLAWGLYFCTSPVDVCVQRASFFSFFFRLSSVCFRLFLVFSILFLAISRYCTYSSPFRFYRRAAVVQDLFFFFFFPEPFETSVTFFSWRHGILYNTYLVPGIRYLVRS